jgi:hypothetical protein
MNISNFKKGDIITRTEPSEAIFGGGVNALGIEIPQTGDRSYMGNKLKFVGIANNHLYFTYLDETDVALFGKDKIRGLALDAWSEGWDFYVNPESLLEESTPIVSLNKEQLEIQLQKAIDKEDYELAEQIQIKLKSL